MKKKLVLLILLPIAIFLNSCNSDSEDNSEDLPWQDTYVRIQSYSKNYGTTGDTITITGENFPTKINDISITFDGVAATILSSTKTEIAFTLPASEKVLPSFNIIMKNKIINSNVKNNYNGSIGIFPAFPVNRWVAMENSIAIDGTIPHIQMQNDKVLYYSKIGSSGHAVYRTLDGGLTWVRWSDAFVYGIFHATTNDEGWTDLGSLVVKVSIGGSDQGSSIIDTPGNFQACVFVEENMRNGFAVSTDGDVWVTHDGINFNREFTSSVNEADDTQSGSLSQSQVIDNNHVWVIGYKELKNSDEYYETNKPFIVYKNNITDGWKEYVFTNESNYVAREVCFVNSSTGFLLINGSSTKLYKTTDGGDTWTSLYNGEKFTKFTFKDGMTGWAILDNKIYKTTNGGSEWVLDYTHDQPIRNIAYKNNVVWAISKDKIIKFYYKS